MLPEHASNMDVPAPNAHGLCHLAKRVVSVSMFVWRIFKQPRLAQPSFERANCESNGSVFARPQIYIAQGCADRRHPDFGFTHPMQLRLIGS